MPTNREFTVTMEDRPGTFGKICRALADRKVNILAFHSFPAEGKSKVRLVCDHPANARTAFEAERIAFTETEVAQVKLPHRAGELARVTSRLGENNININYAYCGLEAGTNTPLVMFGVTDVAKAVPILDQEAAAAAKS
jgi:hypothetical protein